MDSKEGLYVETFPPFTDLPDFEFTGEERASHETSDVVVRLREAGHYMVYQLRYTMLPATHPDGISYIVYDKEAWEQDGKKVYKIFNGRKEEMTLGEATYDLGLLFSEGRVFSDTHFLERRYAHK